jgi:hypothetical protein
MNADELTRMLHALTNLWMALREHHEKEAARVLVTIMGLIDGLKET